MVVAARDQGLCSVGTCNRVCGHGRDFLLAYPGRAFLVCCLVFSAAITLEYLQTLTPDRHGILIDALEKLGGASLGILAARALLYFSEKVRT
jgi:hypothetical protein